MKASWTPLLLHHSQSFENQDLFPSIYQKAARLGFGLASNHAFIDGNKMIGAHTMLVFLELNGIHMRHTQEELSRIFLDIASGNKGYDELLVWILTHLE